MRQTYNYNFTIDSTKLIPILNQNQILYIICINLYIQSRIIYFFIKIKHHNDAI